MTRALQHGIAIIVEATMSDAGMQPPEDESAGTPTPPDTPFEDPLSVLPRTERKESSDGKREEAEVQPAAAPVTPSSTPGAERKPEPASTVSIAAAASGEHNANAPQKEVADLRARVKNLSEGISKYKGGQSAQWSFCM